MAMVLQRGHVVQMQVISYTLSQRNIIYSITHVDFILHTTVIQKELFLILWSFVKITAPCSPAGLWVWDRGIQGTSRARPLPFFVISIAWVESHEKNVSVLRILYWNFPASTFAVCWKYVFLWVIVLHIGIANILQWNQIFNMIRSCQLQSYTIP